MWFVQWSLELFHHLINIISYDIKNPSQSIDFQTRNMRFLKDKLIHHRQKLNFLYIHQSFLLKPSLLKVRDPGQVCSILELLKTSFPYISTRTIFYAMECENIGCKTHMKKACNWMVWHRLCLSGQFLKSNGHITSIPNLGIWKFYRTLAKYRLVTYI